MCRAVRHPRSSSPKRRVGEIPANVCMNRLQTILSATGGGRNYLSGKDVCGACEGSAPPHAATPDGERKGRRVRKDGNDDQTQRTRRTQRPERRGNAKDAK